MKTKLKVIESFNLENLINYGFKKQDYLIDYGFKVKTNCNLWRINDIKDEWGSHIYGITIFESTPTSGRYSPEYDGDPYCVKPRVVYMMDDNCRYMEATCFELHPVLYDLIKDGVVTSEVADEIKGN